MLYKYDAMTDSAGQTGYGNLFAGRTPYSAAFTKLLLDTKHASSVANTLTDLSLAIGMQEWEAGAKMTGQIGGRESFSGENRSRSQGEAKTKTPDPFTNSFLPLPFLPLC